MTTPTIQVNGVTFTFNEGDCQTVESGLATDLDFEAMPNQTAFNSMLYDVNGVTKIIRVSGELSDHGTNTLSSGTAITINDQRKWLEQNINGSQLGGYFDSNYASTWNGSGWYQSRFMIASIRFTENAGNPTGLSFDIQLYIGDV